MQRPFWTTVLAMVVSVSGCADDAGTANGSFKSGTRLRAVMTSGGGDAKLFGGWIDTALDQPCNFVELTGGGWVCATPTATVFRAYVDAQCQQRGTLTLAGQQVPDYAVVGDDDACNQTYRVYSVGPEIPAATDYYTDLGGTCTKTSLGSLSLRGLSPASGTGNFVTATTHKVARGAFDVEVIEAADGAHQIAGLFDHARNARCRLDPQTNICLPLNAGVFSPSYFSDASCTVPAGANFGLAQESCGGEPAIFTQVETTSDVAQCPAYRLVVRPTAGKALAAFESFNQSCYESSPDGSDGTIYKLGEPIPADGFPTAAIANLGEGRLKVPTPSVRGAPLTLVGNDPGVFWDSGLETACAATELDGKTRCVPARIASWANLQLFGDSACTQKVIHAGGCDGERFASVGAGTDPEIHRIAGPFDGRMTYVRNGESCVELSAVAPNERLSFIGELVAPSDFVELTLAQE